MHIHVPQLMRVGDYTPGGNYSFDSFIVCAQPFTKNPLTYNTKTQVFSGVDFQITNGGR